MRTIKPGEAIHSAHSTINPSPGTHEAFCFWNVKRSCHYVLSANHSEFHSGFDALTGKPCIISDMFPICEPDIPVQMQTDHAFRERHSIRYIFWAWQGCGAIRVTTKHQTQINCKSPGGNSPRINTAASSRNYIHRVHVQVCRFSCTCSLTARHPLA